MPNHERTRTSGIGAAQRTPGTAGTRAETAVRTTHAFRAAAQPARTATNPGRASDRNPTHQARRACARRGCAAGPAADAQADPHREAASAGHRAGHTSAKHHSTRARNNAPCARARTGGNKRDARSCAGAASADSGGKPGWRILLEMHLPSLWRAPRIPHEQRWRHYSLPALRPARPAVHRAASDSCAAKGVGGGNS